MGDSEKPRYRRRTLARITEGDGGRQRGRPVLFAFGYRFLLRIGKVNRRETLASTIRRGVDLSNPIIAIAWGLARRGKAQAAREVLAEFGYAERYRVRRKTIAPATKRPN